jgi:Fic family protein
MPIYFTPRYAISNRLVHALIKIEAAREKAKHLPLTPMVLASLRETARLYTTHYSTMIEGNRLKPDQIEDILQHKGHFPGRERDEREVKAYYKALSQIEQWVASKTSISEKMIQTLHALVMGDGRSKVKPTPYRDGQNVIRDGLNRRIIYMPPEAKDAPKLMKSLVTWLDTHRLSIPCPILAGIMHYQFATIHPYYDGNGRSARLLTTMVLHQGGYDLKGLYSLEEYYARNLGGYYEAINIGSSHNYYLGRAEADITPWLEYFIEGMMRSFEKVIKRMNEAQTEGASDHTELLRTLDPRQRKAIELFRSESCINSRQVAELFGFQMRTASQLCKNWVDSGFLDIVDESKKARKYKLAKRYAPLIS